MPGATEPSGRIMGHCHLFPAGLAGPAAEAAGNPGRAEHLCAFIKACGFDRAVAISPVEDPEDASVKARIDGADGIEWLLSQPGVGADGPLLPAAAIVPHRGDSAEKLQRAREAGVRILKFHPIIMRADPLDERARDFWRLAGEHRMPVIYHTGGGAWGWHERDARPAAAAALAARYEGLAVMMAHCGVFGGTDLFDETLAKAAAIPNLYLDTTGALGPVAAERWRKTLDLLGAERVIYGNDYPWATRESVAAELEFLESLGLSGGETGLILGAGLEALIAAAS